MNRYVHGQPPLDDGPQGALVTVRDGRHPLAVLTMAACIFAGAMGVFLPRSQSSALDRFLPDPWRCIYYSLLMLSGIIVSVAVWLPDLRDRLLWERLGLLPFTGVLLVYPIAILYVAPHGAIPLGTVIGVLFGIGGAWRVLSISGDLKRWKKVVDELKAAKAAAQAAAGSIREGDS